MLSYNLTGIDRLSGSGKELAAILQVEQGIGHGGAALLYHKGTVYPVDNIPGIRTVSFKYIVHDSHAPGVSQKLGTESKQPAGGHLINYAGKGITLLHLQHPALEITKPLYNRSLVLRLDINGNSFKRLKKSAVTVCLHYYLRHGNLELVSLASHLLDKN